MQKRQDMTENQSRILRLVMVGILMVSMFVVAREGAAYVNSRTVESKGKEGICIVIDAGHGGSKLRHKKYTPFSV